MTHMHHMIDLKVTAESLVARSHPADYSTTAISTPLVKLTLMKSTIKLAMLARTTRFIHETTVEIHIRTVR